MATRKKPGPKNKLGGKDVRAKLLKLISTTRSISSACAAVGVVVQTMHSECERDPEFSAQVERAKQLKIGKLEDMAFKLAEVDGPTLRWLLANLAPDQYAAKPEVQTHLHAHAHATTNDPIFLPAEQRRAIAISLLGQAAEAFDSGTENQMAESASGEILDGTSAGADSPHSGKILPASPVAKANGHAGNGKH